LNVCFSAALFRCYQRERTGKGPRIDTPPPVLGQHNEEIFAELGFGEKKKRAKA